MQATTVANPVRMNWLRSRVNLSPGAVAHLKGNCGTIRFCCEGCDHLIVALPGSNWDENVGVYYFALDETVLTSDDWTCGLSTFLNLWADNYPWTPELEGYATSLAIAASRYQQRQRRSPNLRQIMAAVQAAESTGSVERNGVTTIGFNFDSKTGQVTPLGRSHVQRFLGSPAEYIREEVQKLRHRGGSGSSGQDDEE